MKDSNEHAGDRDLDLEREGKPGRGVSQKLGQLVLFICLSLCLFFFLKNNSGEVTERNFTNTV